MIVFDDDEVEAELTLTGSGGVGKVMLKIDKAKPNSGYRDKNSVDDYLKPAARPTAPARGAMAGASPAERRERATKKSQADIDDEIPF